MKKKDYGNAAGTKVQDMLLQRLIEELECGVRIISATDDITYCRTANGSGSIGAQFRHNLDFAGSLLKGINEGRIDYNDRDRDVRVEADRHYAAGRFADVIGRLCELSPRIMAKSVLIRSEIDNDTWLPSSIAREVEFIHSHTVHHHALIAEKLAGFEVRVAENFGVALSTLEYWKKKAA
jgi:hypothetical protein